MSKTVSKALMLGETWGRPFLLAREGDGQATPGPLASGTRSLCPSHLLVVIHDSSDGEPTIWSPWSQHLDSLEGTMGPGREGSTLSTPLQMPAVAITPTRSLEGSKRTDPVKLN